MSCAPVTDMGLVRDVLTAVDCNTRGFARLGYDSLTLTGSPFQTALTLLLTVYVAVTGYRLFFATGGVHLSDGPGIILKIGAILTLVTSWSVFQTLVFDMASRAPVEIARAITVPLRTGGALAADPLAGLQAAYDQLSERGGDVRESGQAHRQWRQRHRSSDVAIGIQHSVRGQCRADRHADRCNRRADRHRAFFCGAVSVCPDAGIFRRLGARPGRRRLRPALSLDRQRADPACPRSLAGGSVRIKAFRACRMPRPASPRR